MVAYHEVRLGSSTVCWTASSDHGVATCGVVKDGPDRGREEANKGQTLPAHLNSRNPGHIIRDAYHQNLSQPALVC